MKCVIQIRYVNICIHTFIDFKILFILGDPAPEYFQPVSRNKDISARQYRNTITKNHENCENTLEHTRTLFNCILFS
jgi:hypothetical protein